MARRAWREYSRLMNSLCVVSVRQGWSLGELVVELRDRRFLNGDHCLETILTRPLSHPQSRALLLSYLCLRADFNSACAFLSIAHLSLGCK